jgi:hypothetical protein
VKENKEGVITEAEQRLIDKQKLDKKREKKVE